MLVLYVTHIRVKHFAKGVHELVVTVVVFPVCRRPVFFKVTRSSFGHTRRTIALRTHGTDSKTSRVFDKSTEKKPPPNATPHWRERQVIALKVSGQLHAGEVEVGLTRDHQQHRPNTMANTTHAIKAEAAFIHLTSSGVCGSAR